VNRRTAVHYCPLVGRQALARPGSPAGPREAPAHTGTTSVCVPVSPLFTRSQHTFQNNLAAGRGGWVPGPELAASTNHTSGLPSNLCVELPFDLSCSPVSGWASHPGAVSSATHQEHILPHCCQHPSPPLNPPRCSGFLKFITQN
jgi:hypothetical protein